MSLLDQIRAFRSSGDTQGICDVIPYMRFLGISSEREGDVVLSKLSFAAHLIGNPTLPAIHGGVIGALLESAAIVQLLWEVETIVLPKTINITIDYLRSGRPVDTLAKGIITKQGRRVVNVRAEAWQEDPARPIASANAHFLIKPPAGDPQPAS